MKEKSQNTTSKIWTVSALAALLVLWQAVSMAGLIPNFMLPSPVDVGKAFVGDFGLLMENAKVTLLEAALGLACGIAVGFLMAVIMERFEKLYKAFYPLIVLTQTIPTVAIAPLLVLWFGYEMLPKVILIVVVTFFPITVGLLDGFGSAIKICSISCVPWGQESFRFFVILSWPGAMSHFFASLRISVSYFRSRRCDF